MKKIEAIIRPFKLDEVKEAFSTARGGSERTGEQILIGREET